MTGFHHESLPWPLLEPELLRMLGCPKFFVFSLKSAVLYLEKPILQNLQGLPSLDFFLIFNEILKGFHIEENPSSRNEGFLFNF